ncbi:MAG: hypothetical protein ABJB47_10320 [Actinomycetota bacterium]
MSRGLGQVQRFALAYVTEAPKPAQVPTLGYSAREIAAAMTGTAEPSRSAVSSVGRARTALHETGYIELMEPRISRRGANVFAVAQRA